MELCVVSQTIGRLDQNRCIQISRNNKSRCCQEATEVGASANKVVFCCSIKKPALDCKGRVFQAACLTCAVYS